MNKNSIDVMSWLNHLRYLTPPIGVVVAGSGIGSWSKLLGEWEVPIVHFIEADEAQIQRSQEMLAARTEWKIHLALLSNADEELTFYQASNPAENSVLPPKMLTALWPNLKTRAQDVLQATTLQSLLNSAQLSSSPNWLVVDCMPALPILQGADKLLNACDVIVVRVMLDDAILPGQGASKTEIDRLLESNGFRCIALQEERQPRLATALYVREWKTQLHQLAKAKADLEQGRLALEVDQQNKYDALSKQCEDQSKHLADRQAQLDQIAKAKTVLEQEKSELAARCDELKAQVVALTQARDELAKHASERQKQLSDMQNRNRQLEAKNTEIIQRQNRLQQEFDKAEGQIELIKDLLLREPGL